VAQVTSDTPSAFRGYQWPHAGALVEMPDEEAAELLAIAGPDGGYVIVPAKRPAKKAVTEPAPKGGEFSEVTPDGDVTEAPKPKAAPPAAAPAAKPK
jgi:hypothetical protein